jgi:hypothetical protein
LIAEHYLEPKAQDRVNALLRTDTSGLTRSTSIADEATWADKFRDSDRDSDQVHYRETRAWHYVDIELDRPDIDAACFGHPPPAPRTPASAGPPDDCIVDKIEQFRRELDDPATAPAERLLALQFLMHFIGDLHQPLHATDDHDRGGNELHVKTADHRPGNLHHYWDTEFVPEGETAAVAAGLIAQISARQRQLWSEGTPTTWAWESFEIGRTHVYGALRRTGAAGSGRGGHAGTLMLDDRYEADAQKIVAIQLERAGVRLARLLNEAFH